MTALHRRQATGDGRSLLQVAAALGHSSGDTVLRRHAHVFDGARMGLAERMADAITRERARVARSESHGRCTHTSAGTLRAGVAA